jgi:Uma2 family endonuclease
MSKEVLVPLQDYPGRTTGTDCEYLDGRLVARNVGEIGHGDAQGRVITVPPELAIEVLSPDDRALDVQEKIDDYLAFGIPSVWLIDPERQRAWIHTSAGAHEASSRTLHNAAGDLQVPFTAIFPETH